MDEREESIPNSSIRHMLINSHTTHDNKALKKHMYLLSIFLVSVEHLEKQQIGCDLKNISKQPVKNKILFKQHLKVMMLMIQIAVYI